MSEKMDCALCGEEDIQHPHRQNPLPLVVDLLHELGFPEAANKMWNDKETYLPMLKELDEVLAMGALPVRMMERQKEIRRRLNKIQKAA